MVIVDAIPLTSVGKIYKPTLRCDAARRHVEQLLQGPLALPGATVQAAEGGRRGLRVSVRLPAPAAAERGRVELALAAYPFEAVVETG